MKLHDLLVNVVSTELPTGVEIEGLSLDSRHTVSGDLFFACQGTQEDGRKFIKAAMDQGAKAVCVEATGSQKIEFMDGVPIIPVINLSQHVSKIAARFYGDPSAHLKVIGVTGTNGKSSIAYLTMMALTQLNCRTAMMGTLGVGFPETLEENPLTTPDPISIQKYLARFLEQGARVVTMEVSSHALAQYRVEGVHFAMGIFTNLTRDHLDYHGTMADYALAKQALFERLKPPIAILNKDDATAAATAAKINYGAKIYTYSCLNTPSDAHTTVAKHIKASSFGVSAQVLSPWGEFLLTAAHIGHFNVSNFLAVTSVLGALGYAPEAMADTISKLPCVPGRMEVFSALSRPTVVVDYAHTPDALEKVLLELRGLCRGQLICVFGCGGDRDQGKRPLMAKAVEKFADRIIVTNDNPRYEDPQKIIDEILAGFSSLDRVVVEKDRAKATREAIAQATYSDVVLIAGKGHEMLQLVAGEKIPYSDVHIVKECLGIL